MKDHEESELHAWGKCDTGARRELLLFSKNVR
jgi:hypothetical protein